jgi:hypothetical protein
MWGIDRIGKLSKFGSEIEKTFTKLEAFYIKTGNFFTALESESPTTFQ